MCCTSEYHKSLTWMMGTIPKNAQMARSMIRKAVPTATGCAMHAALSNLEVH